MNVYVVDDLLFIFLKAKLEKRGVTLRTKRAIEPCAIAVASVGIDPVNTEPTVLA